MHKGFKESFTNFIILKSDHKPDSLKLSKVYYVTANIKKGR